MSPPASHAPLSRRHGWALALAATFTMAVSYFDRQTLSVLAPTVTAALGISDQSYGWLVSSFSFAYLVGAPLAGKLIGTIGARRGLLGAVVAWSLVAALHAIVPGFGVLFGLRIALGLCESPSFPGAAQVIHRSLPPTDRARGFGVLFTGSSLGAMVAPSLATFLEARWGWRIAFLGTALAGLVWVPVWLLVAYGPASRRALDRGLEAELTPVAATAAEPPVGYPPGFVIKEPPLLLNPAVIRAIAVVFACAPAMSLMLNWGAKYLVKTYGLKQADLGLLLVVPPLFFDIGAVLFGHLASVRAKARGDGAPHRLLLGTAMVLTSALSATPLCTTPWQCVLVIGVAMAGGGGLFALLTADMLSRVSPKSVSSAGGISAATQSLAYIIANPIIGYLVDRTGSYASVMVGLGAWVVPGCLLWILWPPPPLYEREG